MGIEDQIDPYRVLVSIQRPVIKAEMTGRCSRSSLEFPLLVWFPLLVKILQTYAEGVGQVVDVAVGTVAPCLLYSDWSCF